MRYSFVATAYSYICLFIGLFWSLRKNNPLFLMIIISYIAGSEIIWRMSNASIFYESGKYYICLLAGLGALKYRLKGFMSSPFLIYILLLVPSILITPEFNRKVISFYLSGPITLAISGYYFSTLNLNKTIIRYLLLAMIIPLAGLMINLLFNTFTASEIYYYSWGDSSRISSGNMSPNQVSGALGFGALASFIYLTIYCTRRNRYYYLMLFLFFGFIIQSVLTFSRGGPISAVLSITCFLYFLSTSKRIKNIIIIFLMVFTIGNYILVPILNDLTSGNLSKRYGNFDTTGRIDRIFWDMDNFLNNPIFGIGVGGSEFTDYDDGSGYTSHTEFSRLISEHGIFGLMALLILVSLIIRLFISKIDRDQKAIMASFMIWCILFMGVYSMRLAMPSLIFGMSLSCIYLNYNTHRLLIRKKYSIEVDN